MERPSKLQSQLQRTMAALETPLERLVFLASIRDAYTGRYLHEGWSQVAGAEEVHSTAHQMHRAAFTQVLAMELQALAEGLRRHFHSLAGSEPEMARLWLETEPFREMLPSGCSVMEREFFVSQVRLALAVVAASPTSVALPEPDASQPQPPALQSPHRQDA